MSPRTLLPHLAVLIFFSSSAYSISFNLSRFVSTDTKIVYEGDAQISQNSIELNRVDYVARVGRATFTDPVHLYDSATQNLSDFTTHFSFTIEPPNSKIYSDGFTFFLAPVDYQLPPNSVGGFLGLCNTTTNNMGSHNLFVAVEFDTYSNSDWDPPFEHVGIVINSLTSVANISWNASSHMGEIGNAWIGYNASAKVLSVSLTYAEKNLSVGRNYYLSYDVDLMQFLPEWVMVGFTAGTGTAVERHTIHSWEFSSTLAMEEGHGTIVMGKKKVAIAKIVWVVGLVILVGVFVGGTSIVWVMVVKRKRRRRKQSREGINFTSMNGVFQRGAGPTQFSYEELSAATSTFSDDKKLGQGGFGDVYKGFLIDLDMAVAVKKISRGSKQGKKEYITEVKIISQLRHRNLVQLIGWCHDRGEFLLVYEFMPNGSLDSHLFGKKKSLSWTVRYKIATGLATALLYLHEEWEQCVVHRDIKSSNLMLDSSFNAKLGDFGLARLMDHELGAQTTALAGTFGYLAPECVTHGKASKESDVYSFGVVALEIACGRKSVERNEDESKIRLVDWVWELHTDGSILEAADKRLSMEYDVEQMECLLMVGLWCAQTDPNLRPSIKQAMRVLNFDEAMPDLANKMPVHVATNQGPSQRVHSISSSMTCTDLDTGR